MKINIEEINAFIDAISFFNKKNIEELEFYKNGKQLHISNQIIEDFMATGLSNMDFIRCKFYEGVK